jgi:hypothetical protein
MAGGGGRRGEGGIKYKMKFSQSSINVLLSLYLLNPLPFGNSLVPVSLHRWITLSLHLPKKEVQGKLPFMSSRPKLSVWVSSYGGGGSKILSGGSNMNRV